MKSLPAIPNLEILDLKDLKAHEEVDDSRVERLMDHLREDRMLRNPPLVLPFEDSEGQFLILDGATRVNAFDRLGIRHILAQVVDRRTHSVQVENWNHVLLGSHADAFLEKLQEDPGIVVSQLESERREKSPKDDPSRIQLITADNSIYSIGFFEDDQGSEIQFLNRLVGIYGGLGRIERTSARGIQRLTGLYPNLCCLLLLPRYKLEDVLKASNAGEVFPMGFTRFIVSPRALRVNYELDRLRSSHPIETKREQLRAWLKMKINDRHLRFYAESTVLFDD